MTLQHLCSRCDLGVAQRFGSLHQVRVLQRCTNVLCVRGGRAVDVTGQHELIMQGQPSFRHVTLQLCRAAQRLDGRGTLAETREREPELMVRVGGLRVDLGQRFEQRAGGARIAQAPSCRADDEERSHIARQHLKNLVRLTLGEGGFRVQQPHRVIHRLGGRDAGSIDRLGHKRSTSGAVTAVREAQRVLLLRDAPASVAESRATDGR
jgi:hypothetical protein